MAELVKIIKQRNEQVAISMINENTAKYIDKDNNTLLHHACMRNMPTVAMALIETGYVKLDHTNCDKYTALILACMNNMTNVAHALIASGQSKPEHIDGNGNTAMIMACRNKLYSVATALLISGYALPNHRDRSKNTALSWCCSIDGMEEIAISLINIMDNSRIGQCDEFGDTALMRACMTRKSNVALALIASGHAKPEHISVEEYNPNDGQPVPYSALGWARKRRMHKVIKALQLIDL